MIPVSDEEIMGRVKIFAEGINRIYNKLKWSGEEEKKLKFTPTMVVVHILGDSESGVHLTTMNMGGGIPFQAMVNAFNSTLEIYIWTDKMERFK